jgi:hypothetical protein
MGKGRWALPVENNKSDHALTGFDELEDVVEASVGDETLFFSVADAIVTYYEHSKA